jgi:hypothetical protein
MGEKRWDLRGREVRGFNQIRGQQIVNLYRQKPTHQALEIQD